MAGAARDGSSNHPWTRLRLLDRLKRLADQGRSLSSHANPGMRAAAARLFGGWRQALDAAGLAGVRRGRPSHAAPRVNPSRDPLDCLFPCARCGAPQSDLASHVVEAHQLSPRRYEAAYGPMPDQRAVRLRVLAALREYVDANGRTTGTELARRAPALHDAVRKLGLFDSVDAALSYVALGAR